MSSNPLVSIVVDTLARGGAEKVALSIANNLDTRRYTPIMITTREPGEMALDLRNDIEHFSLHRKKRFDIAAIRRLARFFDERGVTIVHSHNHSSSYFCRVVRFFCKSKWKHVVHDHHGPVVESWKMALTDKLLLKNVDYYIGVSQTLTNRAIKTVGVAKGKCLYLPNGVFMPEYSAKPRNSKTQIIQVGRIEPVKNQMMSVLIMEELKKRGLSFEWIFVGKVNDREYYAELSEAVAKKGLEDQALFLGERADIPDLLQKADIGVLTSRHEGLSIAMLEYMAHSLPVVITDVGQSSDVIRESGGGFVGPQEDHATAAQALLRLNADAALMATYGKNNRAYAVTHFGEKIMVESVMEIYDRLLSAGGFRA